MNSRLVICTPFAHASDDGAASPIGPKYPGRAYVNPECGHIQVGEIRAVAAAGGYNRKAHYIRTSQYRGREARAAAGLL